MGYNANEIYQTESNWLKAADLRKQEHKVAISDVKLAEFNKDGVQQRKLELHFAGRDKTLLLNKTNSDAISYIHGPDTDAWIGKEIILYPTLTQFGGRQVEAIRIRPVMAAAGPAVEGFGAPPADGFGAAPVSVPADDFDDDIPF